LGASARGRIVHVMLSDRPWGIVKVVSGLAKVQARDGEVWVAANKDLEPMLDLDPSIRFLRLPIEFKGSWPTTMTMLRSLRQYESAAEILDSMGARVMHFHLPNALAVANLSRSGAPRVYTVHGFFYENRLLRGLEPVLTPLAMRRASAITCISRYALRPDWMVSRAKVIPNGIDGRVVDELAMDESGPEFKEVRSLKEKGRGPIVIFPANLVIRKGQELAMRCVPTLVKTLPHALMVFVGDGPDKDKLIRLSKELGVQESVSFMGFVKNPYPLMRLSDLVLSHLTSSWPLPSLVELEAMRLGKRVITGYTEEKASLYGDGARFLRKEEGPELAKEIVRALESAPPLHDGAGKGSRFEWESISKDYEAVYRRAESA